MISAAQLHEAGLQQPGVRARVEREALFEVVPRAVYSLAPDVSADGWRAAALLTVAGWRCLSHWSAAELYAIGERPGNEHAVTTAGRSRSREGIVRVHRTRSELPLHWVGGFPVTEPIRVLLDLAVDLRGRPLEKLVGNAGYRRLIGDDLGPLIARYPGHRGARNLRAIDPVTAGRRRTESPLEDQVLALLDALAIPPPICQYRVGGHSRRRYRADFAWPEQRVILEADSRSAHERALAMDSDRARDADLYAAGWATLRVTARQLRLDRAQFVASLCASLARSGV